MTDLIVLGTIPGTSIQITFVASVIAGVAILVTLASAIFRRHRTVANPEVA